MSFFPIGHIKWALTPALITATSHCHFQMARATPFRRACQYGCVRVVPRVARAATLLSRVPIWLPHRHNLTLSLFSPVTSFQTGFCWFLHPFFFTGTSLSLWLTSLSEFSSFPGDFDRAHGSVLFTTAPRKCPNRTPPCNNLVYYVGTFALMAPLGSTRFVFAIAARYHADVNQINIITTYLNGYLDNEDVIHCILYLEKLWNRFCKVNYGTVQSQGKLN